MKCRFCGADKIDDSSCENCGLSDITVVELAKTSAPEVKTVKFTMKKKKRGR